MGDDV